MPLVGDLRQHGLSGEIGMACLEGDRFCVADRGGRRLELPLAEIERVRVVRYVSGIRPPMHETKIWRQGRAAPLLIVPVDPRTYGRGIRALALRVAQTGGIDRIMRGPGLLTATLNLLLINGSLAMLAAGAVALALLAGWAWWLLALPILFLNGLALRDTFRKRWPRRISSVDELESELPVDERKLK